MPPDLPVRSPEHRRLLVAVAALVVIGGVLDWITGDQVSVALLYVAPALAAAWYLGRRAAFVTALAATAVETLAALYGPQVAGNELSLAVVVCNAVEQLVLLLAIAWIVDRQRELYRRAQHHARTDELTGVLNRRAFLDRADVEMVRARRYHHPVSCLMIDLDNLKATNDRLGHAAGDRLLVRLARLVDATAREADVVARLGGDEFVVLLPETDLDEATAAAERLLDHLVADRGDVPVRASIGVAGTRLAPLTCDVLLSLADEAMYAAKAAGGQRLVAQPDRAAV